ncbi:hypothetical protein FPQ18DRAFT_308901 [Pyronema domesticum]|nr:hypothetical protein FPQ18DRAFT_308901 [Pyronema domesticum]
MDPFTIATALSGFPSLGIEIKRILSTYISDVKSAPEDSNSLLLEVTALCHVLDQLVNFLHKDIQGDFAQTSALYVAIMACQDHIRDLFKKIETLQVPINGDRKIS